LLAQNLSDQQVRSNLLMHRNNKSEMVV
jgi:hypothetical protein